MHSVCREHLWHACEIGVGKETSVHSNPNIFNPKYYSTILWKVHNLLLSLLPLHHDMFYRKPKTCMKNWYKVKQLPQCTSNTISRYSSNAEKGKDSSLSFHELNFKTIVGLILSSSFIMWHEDWITYALENISAKPGLTPKPERPWPLS